MKTFTMQLSTWLRGNKSALLLDGKYCCLGQFGKQCGLSDSVMSCEAEPLSLVESIGIDAIPEEFRALVTDYEGGYGNTWAADKAMSINDNPETTDDAKIAALRPIFAELGYEIEVIP